LLPTVTDFLGATTSKNAFLGRLMVTVDACSTGRDAGCGNGRATGGRGNGRATGAGRTGNFAGNGWTIVLGYLLDVYLYFFFSFSMIPPINSATSLNTGFISLDIYI
jgi:hypothetical protein